MQQTNDLYSVLSGMKGGTAGADPRAALLAQMPDAERNAPAPMETGGITGGGDVQDVKSALQPDYSRLEGYNLEKLTQPDHKSYGHAKSAIGRTLAQYDPRQGITEDVLKGLNGLGYGTFSGSGDKLNLSGLTNAGRAAELQGDYQGADFIHGFHSGDGKWQYSDPFAEAQSPQMQPPVSGDMGGGPNVTGAPNTSVAALTDPTFFRQLLKQVQAQAGPASTDRNALMSLMGGQ